MALRMSGSVMKPPQRVRKLIHEPDYPTGENVGLAIESIGFQSVVDTFINQSLHVLLCYLEVPEHRLFELCAAVAISF